MFWTTNEVLGATVILAALLVPIGGEHSARMPDEDVTHAELRANPVWLAPAMVVRGESGLCKECEDVPDPEEQGNDQHMFWQVEEVNCDPGNPPFNGRVCAKCSTIGSQHAQCHEGPEQLGTCSGGVHGDCEGVSLAAQLDAVFDRSEQPEGARLLAEFMARNDQVVMNSRRMAVQLLGCDAQIVAQWRVDEQVLAALRPHVAWQAESAALQ